MANRKYLLYTRSLAGDAGAGPAAVRLASHLAASGNEVILAADEIGDPSSPIDPAVTVEGPPSGHSASILELARLLRGFRPDVALSAGAASATRLALAKLAARSRVPLVVSFHSFEEYRTGRLGAAAYYGMPILTRFCSRIVCASDTLRTVMIDRWSAEAGKTVRIYDPVALPDGDVDATGLAARPAAIVAMGRLSREKGFDVLIEAFARVTNRDATLTIAGEGPERAALEAQIGSLGLAGRVHLPAFMEPAQLCVRARLCVIPSRTEPFGTVAVEALAAGLPIVATRCAGPREILDGGAFGTLVPVGDAGAMALAIDAALAEPGDPAPRIARARRFSSEASFAAWDRLLDDIRVKG